MKLNLTQKRAMKLRTTAEKPGAEDVQAMENRVQALEMLFRAAGREDAQPGLKGTYSGLWAALQR